MRRTDRERDAAFAFDVLRDCEYATLATVNADGTPYCIPISIVLVDKSVYFHCAAEGRKLDNIGKNNAVCISGARHTKLLPHKYTTEYESAVAFGKCDIITDEAEKISALRVICEKYAPGNMGGFDEKIAQLLHRTLVCKVTIEEITGKANM